MAAAEALFGRTLARLLRVYVRDAAATVVYVTVFFLVTSWCDFLLDRLDPGRQQFHELRHLLHTLHEAWLVLAIIILACLAVIHTVLVLTGHDE
jgi:hypothetical protein